MKRTIIFAFIALAFAFTSCNKEDAVKDVDNCIAKLNHFNTTFDKFYSDMEISKKAKGEDDSEFDQLKKIASQYYELMNKINTTIKEEKEDIEKGKKGDGYEDSYKNALKAKNAEIEKATQKFEENLQKMKGNE